MSNIQKKLLVTKPEHDPGMRYLSHWSTIYIKKAQDKNIDVIEIKASKVTKKEVTGRIKKLRPSLVIFNGHGNEKTIYGHDNEVLIKAGDNHDLLKGKIVYALSCDAAKKLGKLCADEESAFIGYKDNFIFTIERKHLREPLKDKRAGQFLKAANQVVISLIKGHSASEASVRSKEEFKKSIRSLLTGAQAEPDALEDAKNLWWNMTHQVCLGNGEKGM